MKIIVCVDNQNGMMFNHRRQSQDRVLRKRILELTGGKKLWMNAYSQKQFLQVNGNMSKEQEQSGQIQPVPGGGAEPPLCGRVVFGKGGAGRVLFCREQGCCSV